MANRFACIATSRRRRALAASLSSHAVRSRRASAATSFFAGERAAVPILADAVLGLDPLIERGGEQLTIFGE